MIDKTRLLDDFTNLLEINSPSRKEGAVSAYIRQKLESLGFSVKTDNAGEALGGEVGNIVATLPARGSGGRKILLCCHMDTVAPTEGIKLIREDGIIRQAGAKVLGADDKAGIAAIFAGLRAVRESGSDHGQIQVVILICEEIGLLGSKHLDMSLVDSEFGFVLDSGQPVCHLVTSAPSHDNILVTYKGRAAHAGVCPEEGLSAIIAASKAISRMRLGRVDFETTANVGTIQGGSARNIVPEACEIRAEARSRDLEKLAKQTEHMRSAFEEAARETGTEVSIEITREYEGYKHAPDSELIQLGLRAAEAAGMKAEMMAHGGGSDCNILNSKGLASVVVGVGYEKIHTPEEYIAEEDLLKCAQFVEALVGASA